MPLLITIILGVGVALIFVTQLVIAVWYRRRFGTLLRPDARTKFGGDVPFGQLFILIAFVAALMIGFAAPYVWPDTAFAHWLRSPFATLVYFMCCFAGTLVLTWVHAIIAATSKRGT